MRIAYLIVAHTDPKQLKRLVDALNDDNNIFFIHIDRKTDIGPFLECIDLTRYKNVHFIDKRISVYWGDFLLLKCCAYYWKQV